MRTPETAAMPRTIKNIPLNGLKAFVKTCQESYPLKSECDAQIRFGQEIFDTLIRRGQPYSVVNQTLAELADFSRPKRSH